MKHISNNRFIFGIVLMHIGGSSLFFINSSQVLSGILFIYLLISCLLAYKLKCYRKIDWSLMTLLIIASVIGMISSRWLVFNSMGILSIGIGAFYSFAGLFKKRDSKLLSFIFSLITFITVIISSILLLFTISPSLPLYVISQAAFYNENV